ncbi:MAG: TRAP transporter fused permease subunit, partial [Spirochaetia bacterium]|nr:TRAP transporter fused permease subunit [Spirochaetia bacterium]
MHPISYESFRRRFIVVLGVVTAFVHIGQFTFLPMESIKIFAWHLMLGLIIVFLYKPFKKGASGWLVLDWTLIVLSIVVGVSITANYDNYITMMQNNRLTPYFFVLGVICILLSVEAARRVIGWFLPIVAFISVLYALFGGGLPGILGHRGYNVQRAIITIFSDQGIYGTPIGVSASNVYLFLLFAAFLSASGADRIFQNIAIAITGKKRGGPAKIAVIGSCLFGTISGSAVANVVSTGAFTIPLMKRQGYAPRFAGAVEAVASTGGQFMPPVMGAAAFVLSDISGTPYAVVCVAALLPALMYYLTLFKMVDLESVKHGLVGLRSGELPNLKEVMRGGVKLIIPVAILLVLLLVVDMTPMLAAIYSMGAIVVCGLLDKGDRLTFRGILDGFAGGVRSLPQVVAACACSGIVVGMFALTGLGLKFSDFIMRMGASSIIISLVLSMLICSVLGMGLPTTAAYIICATAIAPALIKIGIPALPTHLFLLYFASISAITPPVAVASYAAASIAEANPLRVGLTAVKLGIAGFALPFTFVLNMDYLHMGFDVLTLFTWVSAFTVCYSVAVALQG